MFFAKSKSKLASRPLQQVSSSTEFSTLYPSQDQSNGFYQSVQMQNPDIIQTKPLWVQSEADEILYVNAYTLGASEVILQMSRAAVQVFVDKCNQSNIRNDNITRNLINQPYPKSLDIPEETLDGTEYSFPDTNIDSSQFTMDDKLFMKNMREAYLKDGQISGEAQMYLEMKSEIMTGIETLSITCGLLLVVSIPIVLDNPCDVSDYKGLTCETFHYIPWMWTIYNSFQGIIAATNLVWYSYCIPPSERGICSLYCIPVFFRNKETLNFMIHSVFLGIGVDTVIKYSSPYFIVVAFVVYIFVYAYCQQSDSFYHFMSRMANNYKGGTIYGEFWYNVFAWDEHKVGVKTTHSRDSDAGIRARRDKKEQDKKANLRARLDALRAQGFDFQLRYFSDSAIDMWKIIIFGLLSGVIVVVAFIYGTAYLH